MNGVEVGFQVSSLLTDTRIEMTSVWSNPELNLSIKSLPDVAEIKKHDHLKHITIPSTSANAVDLLIGMNHPELFKRLEEACGNEGQPYAVRTPLGWMIYGVKSCASYCLKKRAYDNQNDYPEEVTQAILRNFYVDEILKSFKTKEDASSIVYQVRKVLATANFSLIKFISNLHEVLINIPEDMCAPSVRHHTIDDKLPFERALGLQWDIEEDSFYKRRKRR